MQYQVLRDCYVGEVFRAKGSTVELPDDLEKPEKNFKLIGGEPVAPVEDDETPVAEAPVAEAPADETPVKEMRGPKPGEYLCSKCHGIHRESSKTGQRHLKYKPEA